LNAEFLAIAGSIKSFKEPLEDSIREVASPSIGTNFDVGGRPPWEPLEAQSIERGANESRPLIRSGQLMQVAQQLNIWTTTRTETSVQGLPGRVYYGEIHEGGSDFIPARPFMMLQEEDADKIREVFARWIERRFAAAGWTAGV
jgi:phage gpG-like protein